MNFANPNVIFFCIILVIGVLTSFTDLKSKKISNLHLGIGAVLGLIAIAYATFFRHEHVLFHLINGLVSFIIGFILHRSALWRGGDAKLFTLYAFLMPTPAYNHLPLPCVVSLFACSFIAGTIILIPVFIKDIITNHNAIVKDLFSLEKREALFRAITTSIFFSWALFPFYYLARIVNPLITLTIMYLLFSWKYIIKKKQIRKHYILHFFKKYFITASLMIIFGFLMRLWLFPNSLAYPALFRYFLMIVISSGLSTCMRLIFDHFQDYHDRVSFAPLLFLGCILSYTSFITCVMHLTHR